MVTELKKLADLMAQDSVPKWLLAEVQNRREAIVAELRQNRPVTLHGPHGEEVVLEPDPEPEALPAQSKIATSK